MYRWQALNTTYGREGIRNTAAVKVLAATYGPSLGEDAEDAATLMIRHLSDRKPVRDGETLTRLGGYLARLLTRFCAARCIADQHRAELEAATRTIWWQCVRAAVRSGAPGLLQVYHRQRLLTEGVRPSRTDVAMAVLVGLARMMRRVGSPVVANLAKAG